MKREYDVTIGRNSFKKIDETEVNKDSILRLSFNGENITEIFSSPIKLKLKPVNIKSSLEGNTLTLKSDGFAYCVFIDSEEIPGDNYFSLLPGEERKIEFQKAPKSFKISCANNIKYKKQPVKRAVFRALYRLKPLNIANYFYYKYN